MEEASLNELIKIYFNLNRDSLLGYETESLWAKALSNNCYQIKNTPFFVKGVSFEDTVYVNSINNNFFYNYTCHESGHSTYRIILTNKSKYSKFMKYWREFKMLGCSYESMDLDEMKLFAIDIPPKANIYYVYDLLEKGEKAGIWEFEEGHCGHKLIIKDSI